MLKARLLTLSCVAALLAACSGGGGGSLPSTGGQPASQDQEYVRSSAFTVRNAYTGETAHIFPTVDAFRTDPLLREILSKRASGASGTNNLQYGGGPVQTTPIIYVVYWGNAWKTNGDPYHVMSLLNSFYGAVGGSGWLNTVTQYYQSDGQTIANPSGILSSLSYVDTGNQPPKRPTQSQMAAEAARAATVIGDYSTNASYVVAMPHGIKPSGFGSQYCAYHSTTTTNGHTIAWTNLPYIPDAGYGCGANSVSSATDGVTIIAGHEQAEVETDPMAGNGWTDASGSEIGDKCAWTNLEDNPTIGSGKFATQPLWSNKTASCVQSY